MKTITEVANVLQMTTKGVKWRLDKFKIVPTIINNELAITDSQFDVINYQNTNIKEIVFVTETIEVYHSLINFDKSLDNLNVNDVIAEYRNKIGNQIVPVPNVI